MAGKEGQNFAEKSATSFRNLFIVGALIGISTLILRIPYGETIFWGSAVGAGASEVGRRAAGKK